jgi:3-oxoacyl-[acyl-carrier-protein] synthase-3
VLFGDAGGVVVLADHARQGVGRPLLDVMLGTDGGNGHLLRVEMTDGSGPVVRMDGPALALRAVHALSDGVRSICERNAVRVEDLAAVYIHAGNGRIPPLVARALGLPEDRIHSTTEWSGNLGSASLLAAAHFHPLPQGPAALAAVGAGLCWGAALIDRID